MVCKEKYQVTTAKIIGGGSLAICSSFAISGLKNT